MKFSRDVKLETLKFMHFCDAELEILKHENDLKELSTRAIGEVTLREAI